MVKHGTTVFITGLPGAGKSTLAERLCGRFTGRFGLPVTLLDGDEVRRVLSSELGFSREHRELNLVRVGYVAREVTKHGGMAVCALIAPYTASRRKVRKDIEHAGNFVEVYVATPPGICELRDEKGHYAKARAGEIANFTGISDPYEIPERAEVTVDMSGQTPDEAADAVIRYLVEHGCLPSSAPGK